MPAQLPAAFVVGGPPSQRDMLRRLMAVRPSARWQSGSDIHRSESANTESLIFEIGSPAPYMDDYARG